MKKILTACGYNHAWAFKETDSDKVTALEEFVQSRFRKIADSFEEYKEIKPFEFLPGHRALIFGIKEQILSLEESKKSKLKVKDKNVPNVSPNENELKTNLISQLDNFASNISVVNDWSESIKSFEMETNDDETHVKCSVKCPICETIRIVRYDKKYWKLSNITKHLRGHTDAKNNKNQSQVQKKVNSRSTTQTKNMTTKAVVQRSSLQQNNSPSIVEIDPEKEQNHDIIELHIEDMRDIEQDLFENCYEYTIPHNEYDEYFV